MEVSTRGSSSCDVAETVRVSGDESTARDHDSIAVGTLLSRYVVLDEVGRGGMGRVLRAYDPKLRREVALKIVHCDALGEGSTAHLIAEARSMARLSHPNVVGVYDVEPTKAGEVVLVMEYVPGSTLRDWLLAHERDWRAIVARFSDAGRGLAAAHDAGLLHRDFKPSNVLVSESGAVKVTDFGVAKLSTAASTGVSGAPVASDHSLSLAGTVIGTPRYMAPEQHHGLPLTHAADQYAFCVALWEALCGQPPFSGNAGGEAKAAGPPKWPRSTTPRAIVDAIVRGLSPVPHQRWPSMHVLLEALAWDPARKKQRWLLTGAAVSVFAVGGISYQAWAGGRGQRCRGAAERLAGIWDDVRKEQVIAAFAAVGKPYADAAADRTTHALDAYADDWTAMHTEACEATALRAEQSHVLLDLRMGCLRRAASDLQAVTDVLADVDAEVAQKADAVIGDLPPLSQCADTEALSEQVEPPRTEEVDAVATARTHLGRARSLRRAGRLEAAQTAVESAKEALAGVEYGPAQAELALVDGTLLGALADHDASATRLEEALRLGAQWKQARVMLDATMELMLIGLKQHKVELAVGLRPLAEGLSAGDPTAEAALHNRIGSLLTVQGKYRDAEIEHRAALALLIAHASPGDSLLGTSHTLLGGALTEQARHAEAEEQLRKGLEAAIAAHGPEHPYLAEVRKTLGELLHRQGKFAEARTELLTALALAQSVLPPDHPSISSLRNSLAVSLASGGKYAEAEMEFRAVLAAYEAALGREHPLNASIRENLSVVLAAQGKHTEAERELQIALTAHEAALGPEHPKLIGVRHTLAYLLHRQGRYPEAEAVIRAAASQSEALGHDKLQTASARSLLGNALAAQGKHGEAERVSRKALAELEVVLGPDHFNVADERSGLATILRAVHRLDEALPIAELAWARHQLEDTPIHNRGETALLLAGILWDIKGPARDRARARSLALDARASYEKAGDAYRESLREVERWLDSHRVR